MLVSDEGEIIARHGRVEAARLLGRKTVPTLALSHLSAAERRAYTGKRAVLDGSGATFEEVADERRGFSLEAPE